MTKLNILYEDNHVLVCIKPFNVPSQEDASGDEDMLTLLKAYLKEKYQKPGNVYLGLVHRLDRPAGGVMVFAKTSKAASRLSEQVRTGKLDKEYTLCCAKPPQPLSGTMEDYLVKDNAHNTVRTCAKNTPGAKIARLAYQTLKTRADGTALVQVSLFTGRSHQIRVQFASRGCPLLGDARYGAGGQQLALWSTRLAFDHPTTKERLAFSSPPPKIW